MNRLSSSLLFSSALAFGLAITPAMATNTHFTAGDLVLFFQQEGGSNTVYVDLGNAATVFRGTAAGPDAANMVNFLDISATLTSAFGSGWASDTTIYAGLAGVWGTSNTSSVLQNGDPHRTLYVSSPRNSAGTVGAADSTGWDMTIAGSTSMTSGASGIQTQNNVFATLYDAVSTVSPTSVSNIDDQNPFLSPGIQGAAFQGALSGGVQQVEPAGSFGTFGAAGSVKFALDLYRILAKTGVSGQVGGTLRVGSYEGTVTVNSSGQVSFISQGVASSAYDTWMSTFPAITASADKLPTADPDGDGVTNLAEFGFGGDPSNPSDKGIRQVQTVDANGDTLKDLTLTLEVRSGSTFSASGSTLVSGTVDTVTYTIQGSADLVNWNSTVSEVTPSLGSSSPKAGYVFKTFRLNAGNGLTGKGFLRAAVTQ